MDGSVDIINSTLGKALGGAAGGYTAGPKQLIDLLRNRSRPYLFSNTLPPPVVACANKVTELSKHFVRRDFFICPITLPADLKNWDFKKEKGYCQISPQNCLFLVSLEIASNFFSLFFCDRRSEKFQLL